MLKQEGVRGLFAQKQRSSSQILPRQTREKDLSPFSHRLLQGTHESRKPVGGEILARVVDITSKATSSLPPTPLALVSSTPPPLDWSVTFRALSADLRESLTSFLMPCFVCLFRMQPWEMCVCSFSPSQAVCHKQTFFFFFGSLPCLLNESPLCEMTLNQFFDSLQCVLLRLIILEFYQ